MSYSSLFIYDLNGIYIYLIVYVDDIVVTSSSLSSINNIISQLSKEFSIKDLGTLSFFLGINVSRSEQGMFLSQRQYVSNLLKDEGLENLKPVSTPIEPRINFTQSNGVALGSKQISKYRHVLGSLQYLTTMRLDIS